jgi:hypothetical protein
MSSIVDQLGERRTGVLKEAERIAQAGVDARRDLSADEQTKFDQLIDDARAMQDRIVQLRAGSDERFALQRSFEAATGKPVPAGGSGGGSSYTLSESNLRQIFEALAEGRTTTVREEQRALVTTSVYGSPGAWGSVAANGALSLRAFAGIPDRPLTGMSALHPSVTLPTGAAGVGEGTAGTEITGVALSTLTVARYHGWSQVSPAVSGFDDVAALAAAQGIHIARSLTSVDVTAIDAQAGTPVVYASATFEASLRSAVLQVAATANVDPSETVIYGQPAALAVATSFQPTSGGDRGSFAERIYGARMFPILSGTANRITVFSPAAFVCFQSPMNGGTFIDPQTGNTTFATWMHSTVSGAAIVGAAKALATV